MVEDDLDRYFDKLKVGPDDTIQSTRVFRDMSNLSSATSPVPSLKSKDSQETILVYDSNSRRNSPSIVPTPAQVRL